MLTSVSMVLDQAMVGLLRGKIQLWRNLIFSVVKLVLLWGMAVWLGENNGLTIYFSWVLGSFGSILIIAVALMKNGNNILILPKFHLIKVLWKSAFWHYILNLALLAPGLILPTVVTILLSATQNAFYYTAWMIAGMAFMIPNALATVLYAVGSGSPEEMNGSLRLTVFTSFVVGSIAAAGIFLGAGIILRFFGPAYAAKASWPLRILSIGVIPLTIKLHYVSIYRVNNRIRKAAFLLILGGVVELMLATAGALIGGLAGISLGWLIAVSIEALLMCRTVFQSLKGKVLFYGFQKKLV
jgi:O-antigen/teichoic acid export membrane protein